MLVLDAEIYFDTPLENPDALPWDLNTKNILRPSINFGNGHLFSGQIIVKDELKMIKRGQYYIVHIKMLTIDEEEVFKNVENLIYAGGNFTIHTASKILGKWKIVDFLFI